MVDIFIPIVVAGVCLFFVTARLIGWAYSKGVAHGKIQENVMICRHLKGHPSPDNPNVWHELLGQFREDIDIIAINTTKTRELGFPTYLYTALHEWYHSQYHTVPVFDRTEVVKCENEANDFGVKYLPKLLEVFVEGGMLKPEDAKMPDIYKVDGVPEVLYGEFLKKFKEAVAEVAAKDPEAKVILKRHTPEHGQSEY